MIVDFSWPKMLHVLIGPKCCVFSQHGGRWRSAVGLSGPFEAKSQKSLA